MVMSRDSIVKVGRPLCAMIMNGEGASTRALEMAMKLDGMLARSGTYRRRYDDPEERVLHRHLNLYRNKAKAAKTASERGRWEGKVEEQLAKIAAFEADRDMTASADLDLDGL